MNFLIISKKTNIFNKFLYHFCILAVLVVSLGLCLNNASLSEPKNYEYGEITGTIRKPHFKKVNLKWIIAGWILKNAFAWSMIGLQAPVIFGQWGYPICWIAMVRATKSMAGLSFLVDRHVLRESILEIVKKTATIALISTIFLVLPVPVEADVAISANYCDVIPFAAVATVAVKNPVKGSENFDRAEFEKCCRQFRKRYKISFQDQLALYQQLCENPQITSRELLAHFPHIKITANQLNRIRKEWGLNRKQGRPKTTDGGGQQESPDTQVLTHLPKIGLSLFALWLEETNRYEEVLETIYDMIEAFKREHPEENFRLLKSGKETIAKKWKALNLLALAGIKKLSELDYQQHDLDRILVDGDSYRYCTLRQFLGELERINTGVALKSLLAKSVKGDWAYIDGHMIAMWSKVKMHKGYVTMLGRIMAGSKLVVTHDSFGQAVGFDFYTPDTHLTHIIVKYCQDIVDATGLKNFVIDREINSVEIARLFHKRRWGLISLLDANEYQGVSSFSKKFSMELPDGTRLYKASWNHWRNDPRRFVIVVEKDRTLVYWYTRRIALQRLTAEEIVNIYRRRGELQENDFKRMIAHNALNTNFGNKKLWGPDRTHQRKINELDKKIATFLNRLQKLLNTMDVVEGKIFDAIERGHRRFLEIRLNKFLGLQEKGRELNAHISDLENKKQQLGEPSLRADRDFRKQTIMTFRSLWMENALRDFVPLLTKSTNQPIDMEVVLELFFYRRGIRVETEQQTLYFVDSNNLSTGYRKTLEGIIEGFNAIFLTYRGKPILVRIAK